MHRGAKGGVELGFNYRTRLTGLSVEEAEALGVILSHPIPALAAIGLDDAARRARAKLLESLPDGVRETAMRSSQQVRFVSKRVSTEDERVLALAKAIRQGQRVRIRATSAHPRTLHPIALVHGARGWAVIDELDPKRPIALRDCEDLNISATRFRDAP